MKRHLNNFLENYAPELHNLHDFTLNVYRAKGTRTGHGNAQFTFGCDPPNASP